MSPSRQPKIEYFDPKFEQMTKEALLQYQFQEFKKQLQQAYDRNKFYRKKYAEAGIEPGDIRTRGDITKVPVTTKEEFLKDVAENPPYGRRLQVPIDEIAMVYETSGTSGRGQEIHTLTAEDADKIYIAEAYGFYWAGVRKGTRVVNPLPVTMLGAALWWIGAVAKLGANIFHLGSYSTEEKLRRMARFKAEVLFTDPSYLTRLEYVAGEIGIDVRKDICVKSIICPGSVSLDWIAEREERWGAKLYEQYACSQRAICWTCEYGSVRDGKKGFIHWLPHLCLIEVVDPSGKHVASGEEGEVIVTPLGSQASPIIRFAMKDKAKFLSSEQCPCGRPFDGFECASIGRYDDMMKIKGVNIWQSVIDQIVFRYPEVLEYKGEAFTDEKAREQVAVYLEFRSEVPETKKGRLKAQIDEDLSKNTGINFLVNEWAGPSIFEQREIATQRKIRRWEDTRYKSKGEK